MVRILCPIAANRIYERIPAQRRKVCASAGDEDLRADAVENVRNEYISPVRSLKPGVLVLEQYSMSRGEDDFHVHFTATYDAKNRKFRITGVKKVAVSGIR